MNYYGTSDKDYQTYLSAMVRWRHCSLDNGSKRPGTGGKGILPGSAVAELLGTG